MFFAETQNKLFYAITGKTAAEIIVSRADATKENMALTAWKGSIVRKQDIFIAKNHLTEDEIDTLDRPVVIFLETAELRAKERMDIPMSFWKENVDRINADWQFRCASLPPVMADIGQTNMCSDDDHIRLLARALYEIRLLLGDYLGSQNAAPLHLREAAHPSNALHNEALAIFEGRDFEQDEAKKKVSISSERFFLREKTLSKGPALEHDTTAGF